MNTSNISEIENQLVDLLNLDKRNWTNFYILLKKIETEKLWEGKFNSFTAWVKDFAIKTKTHESIIWSRKKAGEVYQNYVDVQKKKGVEVAPLTEVNIAQDTLVLLDKIASKAPTLGAELTQKALNKEIKKKDLREAYKIVRDRAYVPNKIDKEIKQDIKDNLEKEKIDSMEALEQAKHEAVTAMEILTTLYDTEWLNVKVERKYFKTSFEHDKYRVLSEFPVHTGSSQKSRRIDALICENISSNNSWELNLHGIEIKISKGDLLKDTKYTEYAEFVDYLWLAVPRELIEIARQNKPKACGIIGISNKKAKIIEYAIKLNSIRKIDALNNLALKLL